MERKEHKNELTDDVANRFVALPIKHKDIWELYKQCVASFWTVEECDLVQDKIEFNDKLTENERYFITHILGFFAASDGVVIENLATRFLSEVVLPEARMFYGYQIGMETIHSEMYATLIDTLIENPQEKLKIANAINEMPAVKEKANWALKWISSSKTLAHRILAYICVEGIHFSGSFCAIFWLKKRGLMPGLVFSNELISRDEGLHCKFGTLLFNKFFPQDQRPLEKEVYEIVDEAVEIEKSFISKSLPVSLIGMNCKLMCQYIQFVADRMLLNLNYKKKYNVKNPFQWMEQISIPGQTNFFEKRVSEYQKSGVLEKKNKQDNGKFIIHDDF